MKKNIVRLSENRLRQIISESVNEVLNEIGDTEKGCYALSAVQGRAMKRSHNAKKNGDEKEYWKQRGVFDDADDAIVKGKREGRKKNNSWSYDSDMARAEADGFQYGCRKGDEECKGGGKKKDKD